MEISELKSLPPKTFSLEGELQWTAMPGDASNRAYWRVQSPTGSRIVMLLNEAEAFKSEEAGASSVVSNELDFVAIARDWKDQGIGVPKLFFVDSQSRFLVLEDFGDQLLYEYRESSQQADLYKKALDELAKIQALRPIPVILGRRFDEALLHWELDHFFEYAVEKKGRKLAERDRLSQSLKSQASRLAALPQVVVHRDYHSKNLLVRDSGDIGVIDFQDALMGPRVYDLASLLRDSYVSLSEETERRLFEYFKARCAEKLSWEDYVWMSLQRNLKAIGRFYYIHLVKGRDSHLPFVAPSLRRVIKSLSDLGHESFSQSLTEAFPEVEL